MNKWVLEIVLHFYGRLFFCSNEKKKSPALVAVEAISSGADYDNIEYYATPLTTSSLDRGKEARAPSKVSASALACGSLDRGVGTSQGAAHTKIVPTYVNVLIRNQVFG